MDVIQQYRSGGPGPSARRPPQVSILTATRLEPARAPYLVGLHLQLAASAVDWEWVIVIDGTHSRVLPEPLARDPRVRVLRAGRAIGAAAARNLGLGIAHGDYVTSVDDDDQLPPGSLESRLAAVTEYGLAWAGGLLADLRDGVVDEWDCPMPRGLAGPGAVWPRIFGMTLAVTGRAPGLVLDRVVYVYRRHAAQMTTRHGFADLEPLVRHITFERGRAIAATVGVEVAEAGDHDAQAGSGPVTMLAANPSIWG